MGFARDFWNRCCGVRCGRTLFSAVAQIPGWKGRCDLCRSTFRSYATRHADWCCHLDINFLADTICFASLGDSCRRAADRDRDRNSPKSKLWESAVLLIALHPGSCTLAASFNSFPATPRQGTALYSAMHIGY